jgi:hypothetical protein
MIGYISKQHIENIEFIVNLWGVEGRRAIENAREKTKKSPERSLGNVLGLKKFPIQRRNRLFAIKELVNRLLLGKEYEALQIGRFRISGEIHQWMYDRYSLSMLFNKCGFKNITRRTATDSYIPEWDKFQLDTITIPITERCD